MPHPSQCCTAKIGGAGYSMRTIHDMLLQLLQLLAFHSAAKPVALLAPPCAARPQWSSKALDLLVKSAPQQRDQRNWQIVGYHSRLRA